jgi:hypothetical protein
MFAAAKTVHATGALMMTVSTISVYVGWEGEGSQEQNQQPAE